MDKWWRAYSYVFAKDYPNPDEFIKQMSIDHFGNPGIEDERFQFKDQMNVLVILDVSGSMANSIDGKSMMYNNPEKIVLKYNAINSDGKEEENHRQDFISAAFNQFQQFLDFMGGFPESF